VVVVVPLRSPPITATTTGAQGSGRAAVLEAVDVVEEEKGLRVVVHGSGAALESDGRRLVYML